ncbi:MAG TPA: hypothetical protein VKA34_16520 [Balneolales bacterium]|nr:hypothetical protein [Balneolales bacterium]
MIFSIGLFLFGCKNNGESTHIKTFPNAGNYPLLTISSLKDSVSVPDTLNVRAYVVNKSICPRNMYCYLPDGIFISNIAKQDTSAYQPFLALTDPNEFSKGIPYLMSVKVIETGVIDSRTGNKVRRIDLLGYNIVN